MQVTAIMEAAIDCSADGIDVQPEIMIPLIGTAKELAMLKVKTEETIAKVKEAKGKDCPALIGTMIEIPRAALTANEVAEHAEFFSFGTNDLTQMTFGYSRDDIATFLPDYLSQEVLPCDPFVSIDQSGVGQLVQYGVERGRQTRPDLKIGICGEHGGDPDSVDFCHRVGMNYVSCSPFRVPIAILSAAQAALRNDS